MTTITTEQVQKDFASVRELIDRGETLMLEEDGIYLGMFHSVPAKDRRPAGRKRIFGTLVGKGTVPDDIKTPFEEEINEMFYGE